MMTDLHQATELTSPRPRAASVAAAARRDRRSSSSPLLVGGFAIAGLTSAGRTAGDSTGSTTADQALNPSANGDLTAAIAGLQATLKRTPGNDAAWATLGLDYVDQARVTVNPAFDTLAEGALKQVARPQPHRQLHRRRRRGLARCRPAPVRAGQVVGPARASRSIGYNAALYGILADAQTQLGEYDARGGLRTEDDQPAAADSGARPCLVRRRAGGQPALGRGADDAGPRCRVARPADTAFADYYLGELARNAGDPTKAMTYYQAGLQG